MNIKDELRPEFHGSTKVRQGRFLWMDDEERRGYIKDLKDKISRGYYFSDTIIGKVVEELAPVMDDSGEGDLYCACHY